MKASKWELDPAGDVELVLGFDSPWPPYDSQLGWLNISDAYLDPEKGFHSPNRREMKKLKKKKKKMKRLIDSFPEPPPPPAPADAPAEVPLELKIPDDLPEPVPAPDLPAEDLEIPPEPNFSPVEAPYDAPEFELQFDEPPASEEALLPAEATRLEAIPEDEVVPEPVPSVASEVPPDVEAVPEGGAALEPEAAESEKWTQAEEEAPPVEAEPEVIEEPAVEVEAPVEDEPVAEAEVISEEVPSEQPATNGLDHVTPDTSVGLEAEVPNVPEPEIEKYQIKLLVSSRHLSLASPVFRNLIKKTVREVKDGVELPAQIWVNGWDPEALVIVMDVIHGHHRDVPRAVTFKTLVDIALIVEHYKCYEVMEIFGEIWLRHFENSHPVFYGKESTVFLFLAWVFSDRELFKKMTRLAILKSEGAVDAMLLPIPDRILDDILDERNRLLSELLEVLYRAIARLLTGGDKVDLLLGDFEVTGLLLGCLLKEMHAKGLPLSKPSIFSWDYSVSHFEQTILGFSAPSASTFQFRHPNTGKDAYDLQMPVKDVLENLEGFQLEIYEYSYGV